MSSPQVTYRDGIWIANVDYDNRHIPKAAGFMWHGGSCRPGCKACAAKLGKSWWTPYPEKAARLEQYCDDAAKAALAPTVAKIAASQATDVDVDLIRPAGLEYLGYQKAGIVAALSRKGSLIADEMGLGKTIQALGVINNDPDCKSALIVCPASLRINWLREAQKWLVRSFTFYVVEDNSPIPADANVVIVNYDRLKNSTLDALMARQWDCLIADEAHYLKNPDAQRTQRVLGINEKFKKTATGWVVDKPRIPGLVDRATRRILLLTGTPILNRPMEAFPLINSLDPKTWKSAFQFGKQYCAGHQKLAGRKYVWDFSGASHLEDLQQRLRSTIMVRRLKRDVLKDLPAKRRALVVLPTNGAGNAVADENAAWAKHEERLEILRLLVDLADAAGDKEAYAEAVKNLTEGAKVAFEEISAARATTAAAKVPQVVEHLRAMTADEGIGKVIVFAHHHTVIDRLASELGSAAVVVDGRVDASKRQPLVDRFQTDPTCLYFLGGIHAAGVGITLTAASHVVFAELDWTPAWITQCEDRAHRIGQTESVLIQHLVLDGSLDCRMADMIIAKQDIADRMLDFTTAINLPVIPSRSKGEGRINAEPRPKTYPVATEAERQAAAAAIQYLAGVCDGACKQDAAGFSKVDAEAGHRLAARSMARPMTDGEVFFAKRLARKYRRQLSPTWREVLGCDATPEKAGS